MIHKYISSFVKKVSISAVGLFAAFALHAGTASLTVKAATFTNLLAQNPNLGSVVVRGITVTASTATNVAVNLVDTYTNWLLYTNVAYTNTIRYATNTLTYWTNFYGVVQTNVPAGSNLVLVDVTNNLVPAGSNYFPVRASLGATAGNTESIQGAPGTSLGIPFISGIWVTNLSSGDAIVTIYY